MEKLVVDFEIVLIEDCAPDKGFEVIQEIASRDPRVRGFKFSRNFGQHYGIAAGLDLCYGNWAVVMDCDLQDQPEEIPKLYSKALEGYDIVLAKRSNRQDSFLKRLSSIVFYTIFNNLTGVHYDGDVAGFCIISRPAIEALKGLREQHRYFPALLHWIGFRQTTVTVVHASRKEGQSTYTLAKLMGLALDACFSYSTRPLRFVIKVGLIISLFSLLFGIYTYYLAITHQTTVEGWASLMISLYFLSGLIIVTIGMVGAYVGRIMEQTKGRPLYIIRCATEGRITS
jgi:dolichol-phosphate mannosyltransferase